VPITVTVTHDQFDDAASDAGFMTVAELRKRQGEPTACEDLAPGKWLIMGGRGSQLCGEAIDVHGEQFTGIAGPSSYGRLNERTGRYAGLCESCSAVVQKGSTIVVIGATEIDFESTFLPIVTSPDYSPNQLK